MTDTCPTCGSQVIVHTPEHEGATGSYEPLFSPEDMEAIKRLVDVAETAANYALYHHDIILGDLMDAVEAAKPVRERMGA